MQIVQAKVKYPPGKVFPSQHSDTGRVNAVFTAPGIGEVKVWGDETDTRLKALKRNETKVIGQDTRGNWKLIDVVSDEPDAQSAPVSPQERPQAKDVGDYLEQMTALYAACYRRSEKHLDGAPDAAIQACASSVFISAQRKFDLA